MAVLGLSVSGTVYRDQQPNGSRDGGEAGTGLTLYVKLSGRTGSSCNGPALAAVSADPTTGAYGVTGIAAAAGGCPAPSCLDPTGLAAPGQAYPVVSLGIAPPSGAPTTYYLRFRFNLAADPSIVNNHLPLDPTSFDGSGLLVQKSATRNIVEIGEFVDYTVQIQNSTSFAIPRLSVSDRLPAGFAYLKGSARLDGRPLPDPAGQAAAGKGQDPRKAPGIQTVVPLLDQGLVGAGHGFLKHRWTTFLHHVKLGVARSDQMRAAPEAITRHDATRKA